MPKHTIHPVFDNRSSVLILGSFPSVRSREVGFFYGHPQNRFWRVLSRVFGEEVPQTTEDKRAFLLRHRIALWDVVASCEIQGSADQSMRDVVANDLSAVLSAAPIHTIYLNGKTAEKYYQKLLSPTRAFPAVTLPSTSPANAAWSLDRLVAAWSIIKETENSP